MTRQTSRREVLGGSTAALATLLLPSCDALSTEPEGQPANRDDPKGKEAPVWADAVANGDLPPLDQRLPKDPMVVEPNDQIGVYGGQLRVILHESIPLGQQRIYFFAGYDNLVRWDTEFKEIIPNLAHDYEINDQATEYTFQLREGVKWSDGTNFTADDIVFAVEDVLMNTEINPVTPSWLGEVAAEAVDDYTVRLTFAEPNGLFIQNLATERGSDLTIHPAHYMRQFHHKHNADIDDLVREAQLESWIDLYGQHATNFGTDPDKPGLTAWILAGSSDEARVTVERNPYYWKVDPDGSQLPYVDRVVFERTEPQAAVLKVANGDADYSLIDQPLSDKPVLAQSREQSQYHFADEITEFMNEMSIHLNFTHEDPVKREIFGNKDFRIALSHAINRSDIIRAVYQQQGEPWQVAPRRESVFFDEEMAKQYTEHDVQKATEHLDRAYPETNADGIRLGPDGAPIHFSISVTAGELRPWVNALEIVVEAWQDIGLDVELDTLSRELLTSRAEANLLDATVWTGEGGLDGTITINPFNYVPILVPWSFYAVNWAQWYLTDGADGQEPPEPVKQQYQLFDEMKATADATEQVDLMKELLRIAKEEFYVFGISAPPQSYRTVTNRIRNWPPFTSGGDWVYSSPGPTNPWQYFIES